MFEYAEQLDQLSDRNVGVILHRLPEVLRGIVSGAVELDAFLDGIPVGEHARRNRRRGAPAVQGVLPLFLHCQKSLGVARRHGFLHLRQGLPQFARGVGDQGLERTLVDHGDDAALDSAAQQFAGQARRARHRPGVFPAPGLGIDVGEQLGQRFEFDEAVKSEGDGMAVF